MVAGRSASGDDMAGRAAKAAALTRNVTDLPDPLEIPVMVGGEPREVVIRPPGSKSLTNRALLLAALARGESTLRRPLLDADDAQRMLTAIAALGARWSIDQSDIRIHGVSGEWKPRDAEVRLDIGNAGTAARFLAAAAMLSPMPVVIDGDARMRERPIGELIDLLRQLGATTTYLGREGCPPVRITAPMKPTSVGELHIPTTRSSQFISALLMVSAWMPGGLAVHLHGLVTSESYIAMTVGLMRHVGVRVDVLDQGRTIVVDQVVSDLAGFEYDVEPDASGAGYFWAAGALCPHLRVGVPGLAGKSLQADVGVAEILHRAGAERTTEGGVMWIKGGGIAPMDEDLSDMPDAAMTLAAVAAFADGTSRFRGVRTLRDKETDRLEAMRMELAKIGVVVRVSPDGDSITITPPALGVDVSSTAQAVRFDTYNDHRMAMSLALIGLRRPNVWINDPACVRKTYPGFWGDFAKLHGHA